MPRFDVNESRLNRTIDRGRGRDIDSLFTPFKTRREPASQACDPTPKIRYQFDSWEGKRVASVKGRAGDLGKSSGEIVNDALLLAKYLCIHGVPYIFRGTKHGCRKCQPRT
jgi:hypothetical protein